MVGHAECQVRARDGARGWHLAEGMVRAFVDQMAVHPEQAAPSSRRAMVWPPTLVDDRAGRVCGI